MDLKKVFLIPSHPLTNLETQKCYQNKPRFNGVYSRDNLYDKQKDGHYVINAGEYFDIKTHWIALYALNNNVTQFNSFEHIQKETIKFIGNKNKRKCFQKTSILFSHVWIFLYLIY